LEILTDKKMLWISWMDKTRVTYSSAWKARFTRSAGVTSGAFRTSSATFTSSSSSTLSSEICEVVREKQTPHKEVGKILKQVSYVFTHKTDLPWHRVFRLDRGSLGFRGDPEIPSSLVHLILILKKNYKSSNQFYLCKIVLEIRLPLQKWRKNIEHIFT